MHIAENYIFGQWIKDHAAASRGDSIDPATGEKAAQFVTASVQEVDEAISSARRAFESTTWSQQPKLRSDVLRLFADRLEHNKAQVVQTLVQLNGKLQREAEGEVMAGISELRYYAGLARNLFGRVIEMEPDVYSHIEREAIGVAGIIVRNSILLVDFIELETQRGMPFAKAVVQSAAVRAQPIALTGLAAMMGAFFILDDPIFNGLAISLIFGIAVSTLLTLVVIPVLYYAVYRHRHPSTSV